MNLYNYVFFIVFKLIKRTNKYTPESTAILMLSIVEFINVISILLLFNFSLKLLSKTQFLLIYFFILGVNYLYFQNKDRIDKIKVNYKNVNITSLHNIFIQLYACASIFILCYLIGEPEYSIVPIAIVLLSSVLTSIIDKNNYLPDGASMSRFGYLTRWR